MPILNATSAPSAWVDPDTVPRLVVTYGFESNDVAGIELDRHRHARAQVMLVQRGALSCEVDGGLWIVPPRSALWIPAGAFHTVRVTGLLEGYNAFIVPELAVRLPSACRVISVTPLLRELLIRSAGFPLLYEQDGASSRIMAVLLDEVANASVEDLHLPMPANLHLRAMADQMLASPADRGTLKGWAKRIGLSERTLLRLIQRETGMSFGRWRQQLRVMLAIRQLAGGTSIQQVAANLGYESVPSFVTMFRKVLGTSPGRYMAERHSG